MHYNGGGCFDDHTAAHNSSCIYHTLSRDGTRDYARDPLLREERDDLRNERGHFIGSSSSNNNSGTELTFYHAEADDNADNADNADDNVDDADDDDAE